MVRLYNELCLSGSSFLLTHFVFVYYEESQVEEKIKALKGKDDIIAEKENIIQEKLDSISSLRSEIVSLQVGIYIYLSKIVFSFIFR